MRKLVGGLLTAAAASVLALLPLGAADAVSSTASSGKVVHFTSPSGNIDCYLSSNRDFGKGADCLVQHDNWAHHRARPASCNLDWVRSEVFLTNRGRVHVGACRGDIGPLCEPHGLGSCTTLRYGRSVTVGNIRCSSTDRGITCRTTDGAHHGFRVNRSALRLF